MMRKAVIFGASKLGRKYLPFIEPEYEVVAFSDNNPSLYTPSANADEHLPVIPPSEIFQLIGAEGLVIVCTGSRYFDEITSQCSSLGLKSAVCVGGTVIDCTQPNYIVALYKEMAIESRILQVDLSNKCNLRCRYCPHHSDESEHSKTWAEKNEMISWPVVHAIALQAREIKSLTEMQLSGRGEPLFHPNWFEMTSYMLENTGIKAVSLNSNGITLTQKNVEKIARLSCQRLEIILSIDGASPQESEHWRKGSTYSVIKENVLNAYKMLNPVNVKFSIHNTCVLPAKYNDSVSHSQVNEYLRTAGDYLRSDFPFATVWSHEAYYRFEIAGTKKIQVRELENLRLCTRRFQYLSILPSGDINGCGCDPTMWILGNVLRDNMYDVWLNDPRMTARRNEFKKGAPQCRCMMNPQISKPYILTVNGEI
ncbi:MAG: radical SAM protein [Oscillospiraceae bacterium]|nr:radical SAM protein [Oscillospiraceae bacterium]